MVAAAVLQRRARARFDIPPFHVRRADGRHIGKEIDFIERLALATSIKVVLVDDPPTFDAVVDAVASGRADIGLSKLSETYHRLHKVRLSQPYSTFRHGLLYDRAALAAERPGAAREAALRDFHGRIGVIGASAYVEFATASYPLPRVAEFQSWKDALDALRQRKVAMVFRDELEVRSVLIADPAMHVDLGAAVITDRKSIRPCQACFSETMPLEAG